ncbi:hypothetical protein V8C86DRAFT_2837097 [Haematococcus lacustris]
MLRVTGPLPPEAYDSRRPCSHVAVALRVLVNQTANSAALVASLLGQQLLVSGYSVVSPNAAQVLLSSNLRLEVTNPVRLPSGATPSAITGNSLQLQQAVGAGLNLAAYQVSLSSPVTVDLVSAPPPPPTICRKPQLGALCGRDATGAIIGIVIGAAVLLGLILTAMLWGTRARTTQVIVLDEFGWSDRYGHIMPSNLVKSPYRTQYGATGLGQTVPYPDPNAANFSTATGPLPPGYSAV